ncbi:hypothetical protein [Prescottella equi]
MSTTADIALAHPAAAIILAIAFLIVTALVTYAVLTPNPEPFHRITELVHGPTPTNTPNDN